MIKDTKQQKEAVKTLGKLWDVGRDGMSKPFWTPYILLVCKNWNGVFKALQEQGYQWTGSKWEKA